MIDSRYISAVQNFLFLEYSESTQIVVDSKDLDTTAQEIAKKIIASTGIWPILIESTDKQDLSLCEVFYIVAQSLDQREGKNTPLSIQNASSEEKVILSYITEKLSKKFTQLNRENLNTAALLLGIDRIHELANRKL